MTGHIRLLSVILKHNPENFATLLTKFIKRFTARRESISNLTPYSSYSNHRLECNSSQFQCQRRWNPLHALNIQPQGHTRIQCQGSIQQNTSAPYCLWQNDLGNLTYQESAGHPHKYGATHTHQCIHPRCHITAHHTQCDDRQRQTKLTKKHQNNPKKTKPRHPRSRTWNEKNKLRLKKNN